MPDPTSTSTEQASGTPHAAQRAARNIVLLSDGTGNSRGKTEQTNVWRVYEALDLVDPPHPATPRQFAFYDDGVGTSSFKPLALLGGAVGYGLARNVRDLYAFLCRMYLPGDRIYAFGFSRGAFTIRVLVGLICSQGVVPYRGDEGELDRLVTAAYRAYRRRYRLWLNWIGPLRWLRDTLIAGLACVRGRRPYACIAPNNPKPDIAFLGLWDTVAAYGVPVDELGVFIDRFVWPFQMPDAVLNPKVERAVHALSLDDERNTFHPKLWDFEEGDRIRQVWFAGMHSDVGGGYADKGLSHVSLKWVTDAAQACPSPLRFVQTTLAAQHALSDENGPMNDSRHGLAGYYRYNPRRLDVLLKPHGIDKPTVHESVLRRIRAGQDAYAPIALPAGFRVQLLTGPIVDGACYLAGKAAGGGNGNGNPQSPAPVPVAATHGGGGCAYTSRREGVYNLVWFKRVVYFATLLATLVLLALPIVGSLDAQTCTSGTWCGLSPLIRALDAVMPAGVDRWTRWYALQPDSFFPLLLVALLGLLGGGWLQRAVFDAMRRVWYAVDSLRPSTIADAPAAASIGRASRALIGLRTSGPYRWLLLATRRAVLPGAFGLVLLAGLLAAANGFWFALVASGGAVCVDGSDPTRVLEAPQPLRLDTREMCAPSHLRLEQGGTYEVVLTMVPRGDGPAWADDADGEQPILADLRGVAAADTRWPHWLWLLGPFKRELSQPWLQPMARIGGKGGDVIALQPDPSGPLQQPLTTLQTRVVARSSGELFLYVNDALGPPWDFDLLQHNNAGTAVGTIRLVRPTAGAASAAR